MHKLKSLHIKLTPQNRLYQSEIPIIGLTGGIATGKSSVCEILNDIGYFVIDADKLVKEIYAQNNTLLFIESKCPTAVENKLINFSTLRELFFSKKDLKLDIEKFIYKQLPIEFLKKLSTIGNEEVVIYDVPLLFEKKMESIIDISITVSTTTESQISRLLKRDNISNELAQKILSSQMPIDQKVKLSDFCIDNSSDKESLKLSVINLMDKITK
jgi:dephospho-CoA kinase